AFPESPFNYISLTSKAPPDLASKRQPFSALKYTPPVSVLRLFRYLFHLNH
ncbi:BgTH12-01397, partial [Blumeria graminis f. sp. triticale]